MENHHYWIKHGWGIIHLDGLDININDQKLLQKDTVEPRVLSYKFLKEKLPKGVKDSLGNIKTELLGEKHGNLITHLLKNNDLASFREYMQFAGINFDRDTLRDSLLNKKQEFKKIFYEAKAEYDKALAEENKIKNLKEEEESLQKDLEEIINTITNNDIKFKSPETPQSEKTEISKQKRSLDKKRDLLTKNLSAKQNELSSYVEDPNSEISKISNQKDLIKAMYSKDGVTYMALAQHIAELIAQKNLEKKTLKLKNEYIPRRMDALAGILEGDDVCCAVSYRNDKGFLYSFNFSNHKGLSSEHKAHINDTVTHFAQVAQPTYQNKQQEINKLVTSSVVLALKKNDPKIIAIIEGIISSLSGKSNNFLDISKYKLDNYGALIQVDASNLLKTLNLDYKSFFNNLASGNDQKENSMYLLNRVITLTIRRYYDYKKIEQSINRPDLESAFSEDMIKAFQDKKFTLIDPENSHGKDVHAEMRILDHLYFRDELPIQPLYIGVSMLCCSHCKLIMDSPYLKVSSQDGGDIIQNSEIVRGTHGKPFPWQIPLFLKNKSTFENIFSNDQKLLSYVEELGLDNVLQTIGLIDHFYDKNRFSFAPLIKYANKHIIPLQRAISTSAPVRTTNVESLSEATFGNLSPTQRIKSWSSNISEERRSSNASQAELGIP